MECATNSILLVGAGGHAMSCIDVIEQQGTYSIGGLVGRPEELGRKILGYPIVATDDQLALFFQRIQRAVVVVGQIKSVDRRIALFRALLEIGFSCPTIVSRTAYVSPHAKIGAGTMVMHGAIVNAGVIVGENCIINSRALIEHGATIGDHCHVATGAVVNGDVCLGEGSFLGSASVIREGIVVGQRCVIGMGMSVRKNLPDDTLLHASRDHGQ